MMDMNQIIQLIHDLELEEQAPIEAVAMMEYQAKKQGVREFKLLLVRKLMQENLQSTEQ